MTTGPRYTRDHEYIRLVPPDGGPARGRVGIGPWAVSALGGIVAVTLPHPGRIVRAGESVAAFESVKAVCEVFSPVSGIVTAVNALLIPDPAAANDDPAGAGWFFELELADATELDRLLDADDYARYLKSLAP